MGTYPLFAVKGVTVYSLSFFFSVDGDLITIMDSSDLNLAKQLSRKLKITIFGEPFTS